MKNNLLFITLLLLFSSCTQEMETDLLGSWKVNSIYISDTSSIKSSLLDCFLISNQEYIGQLEFEKNRNIQVYNKQGGNIGLGCVTYVDNDNISIRGFCVQEMKYTIERKSDKEVGLTSSLNGETIHVSLIRQN